MPSELINVLKDRYFKSKENVEIVESMKELRVKNAISAVCDEYLKDSGQVLKFEVSEKDLPYVIVVINEEPLYSIYEITQVDKLLFVAKLKSIEL